MSTDAVAAAAASSSNNADSTSAANNFSQADFYKLLIAEMQNQDPTNPVDNKEMVLQLAQFSAVQSTQNLNTNMNNYINTASLSTATSMLGKQVVYVDSKTGTDVTGTVSAVKKSDSGYAVTVNNTDVALSNIRQIAPAATTASTQNSSSTTN
jgi:flagellar basal-body rod modification protein FlgD